MNGICSRLLWLPTQDLARLFARGRIVERREMGEPTKVLGRLFGRLAHDWHVQVAANHLGDIAERHALLVCPVIASARRPPFNCKSKKTRSIKAMHRTSNKDTHGEILQVCTQGPYRVPAYPGKVVPADYAKLAPRERNILRLMFNNSDVRRAQPDWESAARFVVAAFRAEAVRAGAEENIKGLVDELCQESPEFAAMWRDHDVRTYGEGTKQLRHPKVGLIALEYSAFAVDGRPDLGMVIYNPATPADAERIRSLLEPADAPSRSTRRR